MDENDTPPTALFLLRVLVEFDSVYNVYVARCLETGSVATADDPETVIDMIQELLWDEVGYALQHDDIANLFSSPSLFEVWKRWFEAAKSTPRKPVQRAIHANNEEVPTEISIIKVGKVASGGYSAG